MNGKDAVSSFRLHLPNETQSNLCLSYFKVKPKP